MTRQEFEKLFEYKPQPYILLLGSKGMEEWEKAIKEASEDYLSKYVKKVKKDNGI